MAAAVRSAMIAVNYEGGGVHIAFDPIDVFVTDAGWLTVRDGPHGFEEHKDLQAFESAYHLQNLEPELVALAYEMEAMCEAFLLHATEEGNNVAQSIWGNRRDRCRAAIAASIAKSTANMRSAAANS